MEELLTQYSEGEDENGEKRKAKDLEGEDLTKYEGFMQRLEALDETIAETERLEEIKKKNAARKIAETEQKREKEQDQKYSFFRAIRQKFGDEKFDGFEAEMDQEARHQGQAENVSYAVGSLAIPFRILNGGNEQRDMTAGTSSQGGYAVATELKDFIAYLWDRSVLRSVGADFMTGLVGNIAFPKELTVPTATWEGETDSNAESSPTLTQVTMSPKRVGTYTDISNRLLIQTSPSIENRIRGQLMRAMNNGIEYAALHEDGTGGAPTGVASTSGIGSVALGTNGGYANLATLIDLETAISQDNADTTSMAYVTNAKVRGKLKQTLVDAGSGLFVWPVNATELNGYKVGISNLVSSSLTKGTASTCSAIFLGNWNELVIGQWGGMEILADPYTQATSSILRLVVNIFCDVAVLHGESFSLCADVLTT